MSSTMANSTGPITTDPTATTIPSTSVPSPASSSSSSSQPTSKVKTIPTPHIPAKQKWNTKNLGLRIASDTVAAGCAGAIVAPVISIIDRSIMENASGRSPLLTSLATSLRTLLTNPARILFSRPSGLILLLYGGTYLTANALDTVTSTVRNRPSSTVTSGTAKFAASSTANISLCIYKDHNFVRMFGPPGVLPRPIPPASYALFAIRDCLTIFASFNVPPLLAPHLSAALSEQWQRHLSGATMAQFIAPAAVQFVSTPLHLLGLDLYNRPGGRHHQPSLGVSPGWRDRFGAIGKNWLGSSVARIGRIVPAFGVGGVVNMKVRKSLMERLD